MKFYSTNNKDYRVGLRDAVIQGLAPDNGLYMPERIPRMPDDFFRSLPEKSFSEISLAIAENLIGDDLPPDELRRIIDHTIQFDAPLVEIEDDVFALELFHGPTMAFKDFGARFMSQLLGYFAGQQQKEITILVATSGDTGSAVANGFLDVPGTRVVVLYPSGKVSDIQERQFTTLGSNVTALEVEGTFDDCQKLVKQAFLEPELQKRMFLTSANSINIARLIPQSFYYFYAFSRVKNRQKPLVFSVPSGNFGNLTGGILALRMGLPVKHFVASTNANDIVPRYLRTRSFEPRASLATISNAMDVGNPSNFSRLLELFDNSHEKMEACIRGYSFTDKETATALRSVFGDTGYLMDPHGAVAYLGLKKYREDFPAPVSGIFLETAHPGKFLEVVRDIVKDDSIALPNELERFLNGKKQAVKMGASFGEFRSVLKTL